MASDDKRAGFGADPNAPLSDTPLDSATPVAQPTYTTTPPEDRVSGADDRGKYQAPEGSDPTEVTAAFDHLATRDPQAMEARPQAPEWAGRETVEGLGGEALGGVVPTVGAGIEGGAAMTNAVNAALTRDLNPNPGYTAPAVSSPPHPQDGDLPGGADPGTDVNRS